MLWTTWFCRMFCGSFRSVSDSVWMQQHQVEQDQQLAQLHLHQAQHACPPKIVSHCFTVDTHALHTRLSASDVVTHACLITAKSCKTLSQSLGLLVHFHPCDVFLAARSSVCAHDKNWCSTFLKGRDSRNLTLTNTSHHWLLTVERSSSIQELWVCSIGSGALCDTINSSTLRTCFYLLYSQ